MSLETKVIHEQFESQAAATPDAVALVTENSEVTYRELNARANSAANELIRLGVSRGTLAALCMERSPEAVVAMLAILKAGAAYVPLDPGWPDERLAFVLADTGAPVVLVHPSTEARAAALAGRSPIVCLNKNGCWSRGAVAAGHAPHRAYADDAAYVMYTSGSTGQPKGVLVRHRGVVSLVRGTDYCDFGPAQVFLLHSPLTFDASTFEIWGALLNGGRLAILQPGPPVPDVLAGAIRAYGVTTIWLTAGLFHLMVEQRPEELARVRQVLAGGDVLSPAHVRKALETRGSGILVNGYGPTETTTFACCFRMTREFQTEGSVPIGRPIARTTVYVFDEDRRPVADGEAGELYIGGDGVAAGYLNQPDLTRERFIPDPLGDSPGSVLYRTGDKVRTRPDGLIEFVGRMDGQLKIAGHRIEPEEIQAALLRDPAVRQAAVTARALPSGDKQLVAYVVPAGSSTLSAATLKASLGECLPRHMVPSHIVCLNSLPLTQNGKVDREALPAPTQPDCPLKSISPSSDGEREIAAIWKRVLGQSVGCEENFFDLGGSSLQLLEIHAMLSKQLSREIPFILLFEHPTVRSLARQLAGTCDTRPVLTETRDRARLQRAAMSRRRQIQ